MATVTPKDAVVRLIVMVMTTDSDLVCDVATKEMIEIAKKHLTIEDMQHCKALAEVELILSGKQL